MERLRSVIQPSEPPKRRSTSLAKPSLPSDCNFRRMLANSPAATLAFLACDQALAQGQLSHRERSLLALTVAEINGSEYCLSLYYAQGRQAGLTEDELRCARKATAAQPQREAMLRFVQAVTLQRGEISDTDFAALRQAGFTDGQITEIVANIALCIFSNYFTSLAGTITDFPLVKPGLDAPRA